MDEKHPLKSKTIVGVLVALLASLTSMLDMDVVDSDLQSWAEGILVVAGAILAIYGRFKAKGKIKVPGAGGSAAPLLLAGLMALVVYQPGCSLETAKEIMGNPTVSRVTKMAANLAVLFTVGEVAGAVHELQPFLPMLNQGVNRIFANNDEPRTIAEELKKLVIDTGATAAEQQLLLEAMKRGLEVPPDSPGTTGSSAEEFEFRTAISSAL